MENSKMVEKKNMHGESDFSNMSGNKITVIVPIYNVEEYLPRCIESIVNQTYANLEIILIDDGSTDTSLEIAKKYESKDKRIKVIAKENGGASSCRNLGIELANGDYITFVDSDDSIDVNAYCELMQLKQNKETDIILFGMRILTENNVNENIKDVAKEESFEGEEVLNRFFCIDGKKMSTSSCNKLYKKELLKDIRFVENYTGEDIYFNYQAFKKAKVIIETSAVYYNYYVRKGSVSYGKIKKNSFDCLIMWEKVSQENSNKLFEKQIIKQKVYNNFSLLLRMAIYGCYENFYEKEIYKKKAMIYFRRHINKLLFSSEISFAKKMAAILLYLNFNFCSVVGKKYFGLN